MASIKQRFLDWLHGGRALFDTEELLSSPDGSVKVKISLRQGHISYSVTKNESTILRDSKLGLKFRNAPVLTDYLSAVRTTQKSINETWETVWGEEHFINDNFNELAIYLSETSKTKRLFTVRFRAFNDGFAFRYEIPP